MQENGISAAKSGEEEKLKSMSVEETFQALDALIEKLERGEGSLEDAFLHYEKGMRLVRHCGASIDKIEKQVQILSQESEEKDADGSRF